MNSIHSIFNKIQFAKRELIPNKGKTSKYHKKLVNILLINKSKSDILSNIKIMIEGLKDFSDETYRIIVVDFTNQIDFNKEELKKIKNIHFYTFFNFVDSITMMKFISKEFGSDYILYYDLDYFIENINISEILKLFSDHRIGAITFPAIRGKDYLSNYRYIPKLSNDELKGCLDKIDDLSMTFFIYDRVFVIRTEIIAKFKNHYLSLNLSKKIKKLDEFCKFNKALLIDLSINLLESKKFIIVNNLAKISITENYFIETELNFDKNIFLKTVYSKYFNKNAWIKSFIYGLRLLLKGLSIKDILKIIKIMNADRIKLNSNEIIIFKTSFKEDIVNIFQLY